MLILYTFLFFKKYQLLYNDNEKALIRKTHKIRLLDI